VAALIKDFTERHLRQHRKHPEYAERILQKELADWAHRDARTIKPREVIELLDAIVDRPAPVMANRVAGLLSQLFRYGHPSADCRILAGAAALSPGRHRTATTAGPR
jgi:hypothetical protein